MKETEGGKSLYNCSFCGKRQEDVARLIAGPGAVYICNECVDLCKEIVSEDSSQGGSMVLAEPHSGGHISEGSSVHREPVASLDFPLRPLVGIIMGSKSDWATMQNAAETLDKLGIKYEVKVVSAHRTPDLLFSYAKTAEERGLRVIIAGAGGAAHLPGMCAAMTALPVLGVPIESKALKGIDSLLSIVQMPGGVPVGTLAIGPAGATNAALFAASILAIQYPRLGQALQRFRSEQTQAVLGHPDPRDG